MATLMDLIAGYSQGGAPVDDSSQSLGQAARDLYQGLINPKAWQEVKQATQRTTNIAPAVLESLARGSIAQVPGTIGDTSSLLRQLAPQTMQQIFGNRTAPTTEEILGYVPRATPAYQGSQEHEMVGGLLSPAMGYFAKALPLATKDMPIGNMIAYHGTPHEIKGGFDISKVGTGEGAQAYGHGMYFAENPAVAKEYQKLEPANGSSLYIRRTFKGEELTPQTPEYHAAHMVDKLGLKKAKEEFESWLKNPPSYADENLKSNWQKSLDILKNTNKKSDFGTLKHEGNLYKVDIPDKDIPNMLDWDKPLSQQPKSVQNALAKYDPDLYSPKGNDYDLNELGQMIYNRIAGLENVRTPSPINANVKASNKLNELGITGIRYLDQGSRGKSGTSNFVVFDPKEVKILEKNSKKYGE
jgi:hypothetical protein